MSGKPTIALALSRGIHGMMFVPRDLARLEEVGTIVGPVETASAAELEEVLSSAQIAITGWGSPRFDDALLARCPKLKLIAHSAGSVKRIVTDAVYDRGIHVTTAAGANAAPVAETAVAMIVVMLKKIPWFLPTGGDKAAIPLMAPIRELRDLNVGVIGASRVGREMIRLLKVYPRLRVLMYDPHLSTEAARELGVELATLEDVCRSDVVSVCAPSIAATRHMLNAKTLALLPDHAVLVNTSRGTLIDEAALIAEVQRRPLYVYLDVTDPEPHPDDSPLRREKNILITPHIAGGMNQARRDMGRLAIDETLRFLRGEALQHEVTRAMLPTQA